MSDSTTPPSHALPPAWQPHPLGGRNETPSVVDIWGDLTEPQGKPSRYARWIFILTVVGLCAWAASASFPVALHYMAGG